MVKSVLYELVDALTQHFSPKSSEIVQRHKFHTCLKKLLAAGLAILCILTLGLSGFIIWLGGAFILVRKYFFGLRPNRMGSTSKFTLGPLFFKFRWQYIPLPSQLPVSRRALNTDDMF